MYSKKLFDRCFHSRSSAFRAEDTSALVLKTATNKAFNKSRTQELVKPLTDLVLTGTLHMTMFSFLTVSLCNEDIKWQSNSWDNIAFIYEPTAGLCVDTKQSVNPITEYCTQFKSK